MELTAAVTEMDKGGLEIPLEVESTELSDGWVWTGCERVTPQR